MVERSIMLVVSASTCKEMKLLMEDKYVHGRDPFSLLVKVNLKPIGKPSNNGEFKQITYITESHFAEEDDTTLVIHRFLTANEKEKEWSDTKMFLTWVKCGDRLVNLVSDNGSAINFIAKEVIEKLYWPTTKLPTP